MKSYSFIVSFLVFTVLLAVPPLVLQYTGNNSLLVPHFWGMFGYISGITFLAILAVILVQRKNTEMYAQAFMGATVFKMLAFLVFVLIFIKKTHPEKITFVADIMYLYFLNTAFEVYGLLSNLRNQKNR